MAQIQPTLIAQFAIDFATDTLLGVVGEAFGIDASSFTVVTPSTSYTIDFDDDAQATDAQRQVVASATGAVIVAEGPLLVTPTAGPPEGLAISSTQIVAGTFAVTASANTVRFSVFRHGVVS